MKQIHNTDEGSSAATQLTVPNLSLYSCVRDFVHSGCCLKQPQLLISAFICPLESHFITEPTKQRLGLKIFLSEEIYFRIIMTLWYKYGDNSAPHPNEDKVGNSKRE